MSDDGGDARGQQLRRSVEQVDWYHSIDLGDGLVTPGAVPLDALSDEIFPRVAGCSVLDIGTWDGANAFRAERLGASRVVAVDHYAWGVDFPRRESYWRDCADRGEFPDHTRDEIDFWDPSLPRKRGFDVAHDALGSKVEPLVADFMTTDLTQLGKFDVVLYLGVLYHVQEPLRALKRVRQVTSRIAMIETEAVHVRFHPDASLMSFYPGDELRSDFGNWYAPTEAALHGLCRSAGFSRVVTKRGVPRTRSRWTKPVFNYRIVVHALV